MSDCPEAIANLYKGWKPILLTDIIREGDRWGYGCREAEPEDEASTSIGFELESYFRDIICEKPGVARSWVYRRDGSARRLPINAFHSRKVPIP